MLILVLGKGKTGSLVAEVALHAVDDEFVGQAAGLGAFAAVRAALAKGLAGEALAGVGDTQRAVNEDLKRQCFLAELGQLAQGEFACEHGLRNAKLSCKSHAFRRGECHLR